MTDYLDWTADRTVVVPAGVYYLCDPCYIVNDDEWDSILENSRMLNDVYAEYDRGVICGFSTALGDGTYTDNYGNSYDVDAGLIGLVDCRYADSVDQKFLTDHRVVTFAVPTTCTSRDSGRFLTFGDTVIDTCDDGEDGEDRYGDAD